MEQEVRRLFQRYAEFFMNGLSGDIDKAAIAELYATDFIAASPAGVMSGKNDDAFVQSMVQGYDHYRRIGTQDMRIRDLAVVPIDDLHCVAQVSWTATYARDDLPETAIDFDVHYFVQVLNGKARVFGWVSGDEDELLRQRGVI